VGDVGSIFALALLAMFNPTLLAAVTVMMLLPKTKTLMFGYLLGAYLTSISLGLIVVFTLHNSGATESARQTLSPVEDLTVGAILIIAGLALRTTRVEQMRERRAERKASKHPEEKASLPERLLGRGSARISFAVGVVLSFPGVSYLTALNRMADLEWAAVPTALFVILFCLIQQLLLEVPLLGFAVAPEWTQQAVVRFRGWLARNGRRAGAMAAIVLGGLLIVRGLVELLT
jgi:Sap, sulfolipid-1-addressing protein